MSAHKRMLRAEEVINKLRCIQTSLAELRHEIPPSTWLRGNGPEAECSLSRCLELVEILGNFSSTSSSKTRQRKRTQSFCSQQTSPVQSQVSGGTSQSALLEDPPEISRTTSGVSTFSDSQSLPLHCPWIPLQLSQETFETLSPLAAGSPSKDSMQLKNTVTRKACESFSEETNLFSPLSHATVRRRFVFEAPRNSFTALELDNAVTLDD